MSGGFCIAQVCQTLWTAAFRPKYVKQNQQYISTALLAGVAYALSRSHASFVASSVLPAMHEYLLYFFPVALHFGWTTAATLVNLNGSVAMDCANPKVLAWTGHVSAVAATVVGAAVSLTRQAPVFGGVIAWALTACSTGMQRRLEQAVSLKNQRWTKKKEVVTYGVRAQKWLCAVGAVISAGASLAAAFSRTK